MQNRQKDGGRKIKDRRAVSSSYLERLRSFKRANWLDTRVEITRLAKETLGQKQGQ
jgi:hypothetical protein